MEPAPTTIIPGRCLGPICLGASLYEVLTIVKEQKQTFPAIHLHHSSSDPLTTPVVVALPQNGLRLRFDAADQRLRLIEVMDFGKIKLAHKGSELVKSSDAVGTNARPGFRRTYQIFGASYPGEYHPPKDGSKSGSYVLSWTGIAFTFPLEHSVYGPQKDHVSMLGSSAASSATQMALFEGSSWPEARKDLFVRVPNGPRCSALAQRPKDNLPAEIEHASLEGDGKITLIRTPPAAPFVIVLNQTTPQDLITELGPPDATKKRDVDTALQQHQPSKRRTSSISKPFTNGRTSHAGSQPSSYSSTGTDTFETDFDSGDADDNPADRTNREIFWCYFTHGMDILIGPSSPSRTTATTTTNPTTSPSTPHLTVQKVIIQANIPGSYTFARHRRLRWTLALPRIPWATDDLHSEANFTSTLQPSLLQAFEGIWSENEMSRGKVVNRTWGTSGGGGEDSTFFLPDAGEDLVEGQGSETWLGNSRVFSFPGLGVEVLENGVVGSLSVY